MAKSLGTLTEIAEAIRQSDIVKQRQKEIGDFADQKMDEIVERTDEQVKRIPEIEDLRQEIAESESRIFTSIDDIFPTLYGAIVKDGFYNIHPVFTGGSLNNTTGEEIQGATWKRTTFIPCKEDEYIEYTGTLADADGVKVSVWAYFYNESSTFISPRVAFDNGAIAPSNAKYVRFAIGYGSSTGKTELPSETIFSARYPKSYMNDTFARKDGVEAVKGVTFKAEFESGSIDQSNGKTIKNDEYVRTKGFLPCGLGVEIPIPPNPTYTYLFLYDSTKTYLRRERADKYKFDSDGYYKIAFRTSNIDIANDTEIKAVGVHDFYNEYLEGKGEKYAPVFCNTVIDRPIGLDASSKVIQFGDSITTTSHGGYTWISRLAQKIGCIATSYGIGGAGYSSCFHDSDVQADRNLIINQINCTQNRTVVAKDGKELNFRAVDWTGVTHVFLCAGVNDATSGATASEFRTAFETALNTVIQKAPNAKIVVITPIRTKSSHVEDGYVAQFGSAECVIALSKNADGKSVSVINGFDIPIPDDSCDWYDEYTDGDNLHPNAIGKYIYAQAVLSALL